MGSSDGESRRKEGVAGAELSLSLFLVGAAAAAAAAAGVGETYAISKKEMKKIRP